MDIVKRIAVDELGGELTLATDARAAGRRSRCACRSRITIVDAFSFECGGADASSCRRDRSRRSVELDPARIVRGPAPRASRRGAARVAT